MAKDPRTSLKATSQFISGAVAGTGAMFVAFPFDATKTKLQTFPKEYTGPVQCLLKTFRTQGIKGLYRGLTPAIFSNVNECTVVFTSYGIWQDFVKKVSGLRHDNQMHAAHNYTAGALTGITASVFLCPTELVKCRLQALREMQTRAERMGFKSVQLAPKPLALVRRIWRESGTRGFYAGYPAALCKHFVGFACFLGTYELCRESFRKPGHSKDELGVIQNFISGGVAGVAYWLPAYPIDNIKARIQIDSAHSKPQNFLKLFSDVLKTEGITGMYKGFSTCLMRSPLALGTHFVIYEIVRKRTLEFLQLHFDKG